MAAEAGRGLLRRGLRRRRQAGRGAQLRRLRQHPVVDPDHRPGVREGDLRVPDGPGHRVRLGGLHRPAGGGRRRRRQRGRRQRHLGLLLHRQQDRQAARADLRARQDLRRPLRRHHPDRGLQGDRRRQRQAVRADRGARRQRRLQHHQRDRRLRPGHRQAHRPARRGRGRLSAVPAAHGRRQSARLQEAAVRQGRTGRQHRRRHLQGDQAPGEPGAGERAAGGGQHAAGLRGDPLRARPAVHVRRLRGQGGPGGRPAVPGAGLRHGRLTPADNHPNG
ncbi:hypothetical protein SGPA1_50968 [Streptomyces misionensis JCM 4497]